MKSLEFFRKNKKNNKIKLKEYKILTKYKLQLTNFFDLYSSSISSQIKHRNILLFKIWLIIIFKVQIVYFSNFYLIL